MRNPHTFTDCPHCGSTLQTRRMKDRTITAARITGVLQFMAVLAVMVVLCIEWS